MLRKTILFAAIAGTGIISLVASHQVVRSQVDNSDSVSPPANVQPTQGEAGREAEIAFLNDYFNAVYAQLGDQYDPSVPTNRDEQVDQSYIQTGYRICESLQEHGEQSVGSLVQIMGDIWVVSAVNNLCPESREAVNEYIGSTQYWQDREQNSNP